MRLQTADGFKVCKMSFSTERCEINNYLNVTRYRCTCGELKSVWDLYLCRHCLELRCSFCVFHEIEYCYCERCEESSTKTELKLHQNRCGSCYTCPCCGHQISKRIIHLSKKGEKDTKSDETTISSEKKVKDKDKDVTFYLSCLRCRWSSREIQNSITVVAEGSEFPIRKNPFEKHINQVNQYYQKLCRLQESSDFIDTNIEFKPKKKYRSYTDKTGITVYNLCRKLGFDADKLKETHEQILNANKESLKENCKEMESFKATDQIEDLPEDIFSTELQLNKMPSLEAKFLEPSIQVESVDDYQPIHQQLIVKKSQRCRICEHFVAKPDLSSSSIKFKMQSFASFHLPDIRVMSFEQSSEDSQNLTAVILQITNPTSYPMDVWLTESWAIVDSHDVVNDINENKKKVHEFEISTPFNIVAPIHVNDHFVDNFNVKFPFKMPIVMPPKFDPDADLASFTDGDYSDHKRNDSFVVYRNINKIGIRVPLSKNEEFSETDENVRFQFKIYHSFMNVMNATSQSETEKQPKKSYHKMCAFVSCPRSIIEIRR